MSNYEISRKKQCESMDFINHGTDFSQIYDQVNNEHRKIESRIEQRLFRPYFQKSCTELAKDLLGKFLVRKLPSGEILKGKIVETESYLGMEDKASHSYRGKETNRNSAMFMAPGTAYVYFIYGMYFCFNISSLEPGSAVLIRALEPFEGLTVMRNLRASRRNSQAKPMKDRELCNGPSKLCQAMMIEKSSLNKEDLCTSDSLWLENGPFVDNSSIVSCKRIGLNASAEEWLNKPLRFYIKDSIFVSIKDKTAEKILM